jgi:multidrug efflux pump subunit AcrB
VDIRVMLDESFRRSPEALSDLLVYGLRGPVRLGDVAEVEERSGPVAILHEGRQRQVSVHSQVEGRPLGDVSRDLRARLVEFERELDDGYTLLYSGMQERMEETNTSMATALLLALVFIYVILASQFESLVHPFTIVLTLPLGLLGAFIALLAWGSAISLPAYLGLILLIGLCAKNGILLVDGAITRMRDDELSPREAMLAAGPRRLRPILMTSAAMIFGMLPTAVARETGSEFRFPMAAAVIGGVVSNTLLTLFVLPVIFVGMERVSAPVRKLWTKIR